MTKTTMEKRIRVNTQKFIRGWKICQLHEG